jgi:serine/threonine protein kinase/Tol biopolymer transport system component
MTPERYQRVVEIFQKASDHSAEARRAFLAEACAGDDKLRREVEAMLVADAQSAGFLDKPADDIAAAAVAAREVRSLIGHRISHYEVVSLLGSGGMGEVYRATDTRLRREVAIKFSITSFSDRFEREARTIAALNHPNICTLHDVGPNYLVMELLEGPTLADRIKRGALPLVEALEIAKQIADALEAAHEKGIVHRDLKPANIKIKPDGTVKVLDFGLAKMSQETASGGSPEHKPTLTTGPGIVLGTAAYMSPEQARGQAVDKRTDIWSFGVVLYEMLDGRRAFPGETTTDVLAAVVSQEPDWGRVPAEAKRLLRRCLEKDPKRRLRDIGDARSLLADASDTSSSVLKPVKALHGLAWLTAGLLAGSLAVGLIVWRVTSTKPAYQPTMRVTIPLTTTQPLVLGSPIVLSRDGTQLVYAAGGADLEAGTEQNTHLYLRFIDRIETAPIRGTDRGASPFFSPDGRWVGFFADGKVKKVPITGGVPQTICDDLVRGREAAAAQSADWAPDDSIFFATGFSGLWRVPASGGTPQLVTTLDTKKGEFSHRWPQILPGGREVLFTVQGPNSTDFHVAVESLMTRQRRNLTEKGSYARYASSGHLVYAWEGSLLASPFDLVRLEVTGPESSILENLPLDKDGAAMFALSGNGTLIYVSAGPPSQRTLVWVDRRGNGKAISTTARAFKSPRLSPDGQRLAVDIGPDVWTYDLARDVLTRLTYDGSSCCPEWTPDSKRLVFSSYGTGPLNLFMQAADGSGQPERLTTSENYQWASSWSPDGRVLAFMEFNHTTLGDIWMLPLEGEHKPYPLVRTSSTEWGGRISPDGRWLAYVSDATGRFEVYVTSFPSGQSKRQISTEGGAEAVWSRNGRELFYREGAKMMAVGIEANRSLTAAKPRMLFAGYMRSVPGEPQYDVSLDGGRFVMVKSETESAPTQLNVVLNWFEELRNRSGTGLKK